MLMFHYTIPEGVAVVVVGVAVVAEVETKPIAE